MDEDGSSTIAIATAVPGWRSGPEDALALCRRAARATLARATAEPALARAEVSVLLADDATVRRLNADWRGIDRPTNVLSFPALDLERGRLAGRAAREPVLLGDVVLAEETVRREAALQGKPFAAHLSHLVVHGTLHLLGYDHQEDAAAEEMEGLERAILEHLGIADPYATPAAGGRGTPETNP